MPTVLLLSPDGAIHSRNSGPLTAAGRWPPLARPSLANNQPAGCWRWGRWSSQTRMGERNCDASLVASTTVDRFDGLHDPGCGIVHDILASCPRPRGRLGSTGERAA